MDSFSAALTEAASPHAAWAAERVDRYNAHLRGKPFGRDIARGLVHVEDRAVPAGLLGTYAEDRTFKWGWAYGDPPGAPDVVHAQRLREIGLRLAVPELTEPLVDLNGFSDPRLAAERLAILALGLLGAGGLVRHGHGGRAVTFLISDDPGIEAAGPEPSMIETWLRDGAALFSDHGPGPGAAVVRGYAERHDLPVRTTADGVETGGVEAGGVEFDLPGGGRVLARIGGGDRLDKVEVTVPDGDVPPPRERYARIVELEADQPLPDGLLNAAAPAVLGAFHAQFALWDLLKEKGWRGDPAPEWDPAAGRLRFGDVLDVAARAIGGLDRDSHTWEWAGDDADATGWIRSVAREHGAGHLAEDVVELGDGPRWQWVAGFLARSAARPEGTRGTWTVAGGSGGNLEFEVAVTDPAAPEWGSLGVLCAAVESAADILQPLVPREHRYAVMRSMVYGHFERLGMVPFHVGEPDMFMGNMGLYEVRVMIAYDGTVNSAHWGMQGTLG
ncbi:hypothetical protein GCM10010191_23310 [Actinomadura vinacea]|uniref:Uncharacterized protein n=1 Tax=Actinomadura vinacea TaxID=115336 RepID=A0ABP5VYL7_9ACTN